MTDWMLDSASGYSYNQTNGLHYEVLDSITVTQQVRNNHSFYDCSDRIESISFFMWDYTDNEKKTLGDTR